MSSETRSKNKNLLKYKGTWQIAILCLCCVYFASCSKRIIATPDNEIEANAMIDVLTSNDFKVVKEKAEGKNQIWLIKIDESWLGGDEAEVAALRVLNDNGLPRPKKPKIEEGSSIGMKSERQEIKEHRLEKQYELEKKTYLYPDVVGVNVIIALPDNKTFETEKATPKATISITLKVKEPKFTRKTIQEDLAGGVTGLKAEDVEVQFIYAPVREVQLEKYRNNVKRNKILAVGFSIIILLGTILSIAWIFTKKRSRSYSEEDEHLLESGEATQEIDE